MKRKILISCGALVLCAFASCEPYLSLDEALEGAQCDSNGQCSVGYTCVAGRCTSRESMLINPSLPPPGADGGASGAGAAPASEGSAGAASSLEGNAGAGAASEPAASAGAGGAPGAGGEPGNAGSASTNLGGAEGLPPGPNPGAADAGCTPVVLFRDRDGDGFGGTAQEDLGQGCPPLEGFATRSGDCHDAVPSAQDPAGDVFPGQVRFFAFAYPTDDGLSFDYDCSGTEEPGPSSEFVPAPADCEQRESCGLAIGYRAPVDPRSGPGVNPLCGSRDVVVCTGSAATGCELLQLDDTPFTCR